MATRNKVRETIIGILYSFDIGNVIESEDIEEILLDHKIKNDKQDFAKELIYGVVENLEGIDLNIDKYLIDWDFSRLGYIERAIFRLGAYEILYTDTNGVIVINELVSVSKKYCIPKSTNFINGVLNSVYKQHISKEENAS